MMMLMIIFFSNPQSRKEKKIEKTEKVVAKMKTIHKSMSRGV